MRNLLNVLGLEPSKDHSPEDLKKAWKAKCNETHPDKQGGDNSKFLQVMHAYKMLTDPEYRREDANNSQGKKNDLTIRMQVPVTFEDAFFGKSVRISFNRLEIGPDGKAIIREEQEVLSIELEIPQGTVPGWQTGYPGKGLKGPEDTAGDLIIMVMPQPHPRFKLEQGMVITQEQIPLDTMLKGGEVEVQTMYGLKTLRVPPGTRPGERLDIKGCGVGKRGAHVVLVDPVYPSKEDLKKKEAWKSLDINWANHEEEKKDPHEELFERMKAMGGIYINVNGMKP